MKRKRSVGGRPRTIYQQTSLVAQTFREAGLEARIVKAAGKKPYVIARDPQATTDHQRRQWWKVSQGMWERSLIDGPRVAFDQETLLGNIFSI